MPHGGLAELISNLMFMPVETAMFCSSNASRETLLSSETFHTITTIEAVGSITDSRWVSKLKFYLADVEAFQGPVVVVPDINGDANRRYLLVKLVGNGY
jgi:hypothetical protein